LDKIEALVVALFGGFFLEDDTGDELIEAWRSEEHVSVPSSVFGSVFEFDGIELFDNRGGRFIGSEDAFAGGADFVCSLNEFLRIVFGFHGGYK
jgi:hypothetical protein